MTRLGVHVLHEQADQERVIGQVKCPGSGREEVAVRRARVHRVGQSTGVRTHAVGRLFARAPQEGIGGQDEGHGDDAHNQRRGEKTVQRKPRRILLPCLPGVQNHKDGNQQDGGELRQQRQSEGRAGRQQREERLALQITSPGNYGREPRQSQSDIVGYIAAVGGKVGVGREQEKRKQAGGGAEAMPRPRGDRQAQHQGKKNGDRAGRQEHRSGRNSIVIEEDLGELQQVGPLPARVLHLEPRSKRQQRQRGQHLRQGRVLEIHPEVARLQVAVPGGDIRPFVECGALLAGRGELRKTHQGGQGPRDEPETQATIVGELPTGHFTVIVNFSRSVLPCEPAATRV